MDNPLLYLIDDDSDDREIFEIALTRAAPMSMLLTARNGQEALYKLQNDLNFRPNYVFLDLNMPGIHGIECLSEIRSKHYLENIPIIIYSTSSNPDYIVHSQQLGAKHYLIKPVAISMLSQMISDIFKKNELPFLLKN